MTSPPLQDVICTLTEGENTFVLHSSIKGLGLSDRPAGIAALTSCLDYLSSIGTVLIPGFTFSAPRAGIFDDQKSRSETGALGEIAREQCCFMRTPHRMFSYFVGGQRRDHFMAARHDTAFGPGSAIEETVRDDVLVVMMAVSWNSCTTIHAVEEELSVPYREMKTFDYPAVISGRIQPGIMNAFVRRMHPPTKLRFDKIRYLLQTDNCLRSHFFGEATIEAANAGDISRLARKAISEDPYAFVDRQEEN